ncbi:hypothetical protein OIO90_000910 [Microbotryomycetes sp. JL221]|nr:hypothetical protein OIO90_000910 [Microbotryomycetes sp. JL221]
MDAFNTIKRKRSLSASSLLGFHTSRTASGARTAGAGMPDGAAPNGAQSRLTLDIPDSAYGTMDELSSSCSTDESDAACDTSLLTSKLQQHQQQWRQHRRRQSTNNSHQPRRSSSLTGAHHSSTTTTPATSRRRPLQDHATYCINSTASSSRSSLVSDDEAHGAPRTLYSLDAGYDADSSFDSVDSLGSTARSSPEPSEFEFDLTRMSPVRKSPGRTLHHHHGSDWDAQTSLARRHTFPRRRNRIRSASISISLVTPTLDSSATVDVGFVSSATPTRRALAFNLPTPKLPPVTFAATALTATVSMWSLVSAFPVMHTSPVHLLHHRGHLALETINSAMSPFLVAPSKSALALAAANLVSLHSLEQESFTRWTPRAKAITLGSMWAATVGLRVLLSWIFGRVVGWAHPEWFASSAIHEVGAGLAPLLLAVSIVRAYAAGRQAKPPSILQFALLATNFCTPVDQGGSGPWMALSGAIVGFVACLVASVFSFVINVSTSTTTRGSSSRRPSALYFGRLLAFLALPLLASLTTPASQPLAPTSFASLHPRHPHLLTVLLMTAPRPGRPDFLFQTVESWLGALPEPDVFNSGANTTTAERVRMVVYTHFKTHEVFDAAQQHFSTSPVYAAKAAHYLEWHRDERSADRLDQRLHVARGLDYAANHDGTSAYVMLTEDDFPLCPNEDPVIGEPQSWTSSWTELERALIMTNEAMPDFDPMFLTSAKAPMSYIEQEATAGHCGLFVATGGSGLTMRGFIAAKLPTLLLGADDPHGDDREQRAKLGQFSIKHEDEGADTPDLVIQDCLRGRLPECRVCEAPDASTVTKANRARKYPVGSARNGGSVLGDRWGKSGLSASERLVQHHLGYNASTLPGRKYGKEEWACGWRQPFNGEPDVLIV